MVFFQFIILQSHNHRGCRRLVATIPPKLSGFNWLPPSHISSHLNFRTMESSTPLAMLKTVKRPPINAQMFVRKWYSGVDFSEITTIIGEI